MKWWFSCYINSTKAIHTHFYFIMLDQTHNFKTAGYQEMNDLYTPGQ